MSASVDSVGCPRVASEVIRSTFVAQGTSSSSTGRAAPPAVYAPVGPTSTDGFRLKINRESLLLPCKPAQTAGGTTSFYTLKFQKGLEPSPDSQQYVGKDLGDDASQHEAVFYYKLRTVKEQGGYWAAFADVTLDCAGLAHLDCLVPPENLRKTRPLLLLEDFHSGFRQCRMMDVKLGSETGIANWKGKSTVGAWGLARVDHRTNSSVEGFRLEGMEFPPKVLAEYVHVGVQQSQNRGIFSPKRWSRFIYQRLCGQDMLDYFFNCSELGPDSEIHSHGAIWSAVKAVDRVVMLSIGIPVPQQWVGSSIGLCMEVGRLEPTPKVEVKLFDWARAELTTATAFMQLAPNEKQQRVKFWAQYVRALCHLQWHILRIAAHRCCCRRWKSFVFELRVEENRVLRAALTGRRPVETQRMGVYHLVRGLPEDGATVDVPLLAKSNKKVEAAALQVHVSTQNSSHDACGEGLISFQVHSTTKLVEVTNSPKQQFFFRVIGFENTSDANNHVQAWKDGLPEPTPAGRAYGKNSAPARKVGKSLILCGSFEYLGLGVDAAMASQERLRKYLPENIASNEYWPDISPAAGRRTNPLDSNSTTPVSTGVNRRTPGLVFIPPVVGDASKREVGTDCVCAFTAPWASVSGATPSHWL